MQSMQASQMSQQTPQDMGSYQGMDSHQGDMDGSQPPHLSDDSRQTPPGMSNTDSSQGYKGNTEMKDWPLKAEF